MLQEYLTNAIDGWDLARCSVRNLFAEPDLHAHEVGGDFSGEATRLGEALREVHRCCAATSPPATGRPPRPATWRRPCTPASTPPSRWCRSWPGSRRGCGRRTTSSAASTSSTSSRSTATCTSARPCARRKGWKIVDFEGEPAKPLAERLLPDSAWRDVAGMLRSFDYAPHAVEHSHTDIDGADATQRAFRADEWANRNKNHFLVAYSGGQLSDDHRVLLDAYVADKAVYETVYEARNRPTWITIPLEAIARIGGS